MSTFTVIVQYMSIYYGIPVLIAGMLGGLLNSIVFLSLKTFRQNSCAFYLTIMSIVNIGQLFAGLLSRIMINGYTINWSETSLFYCKFRYFLLQACSLISLTCICLATIDQYFATSTNHRWRQWCNLKLAHRLIIFVIIFWCLHGILYFIFYVHVYSPSTNTNSCTMTNEIFRRYQAFGYFLVLTGFLPIIIKVLFALLAFRNIHQSSHQTVPIIRRELEKQLTIMVLVQVAINAPTLVPISIASALQRSSDLMSNIDTARNIQFANAIGILIYYFNFASPFYIYLCVSERFRRQFIYVLFEIHLNRRRKRPIFINEVTPQL